MNPEALDETLIKGSYDLTLVTLSFLVGVFSSLVPMILGDRIKEGKGWTSVFWIGGCTFSLGGGIWAMHFIAMLALKMPIPVHYDPSLTFISFAIAVFTIGCAFLIVRKQSLLLDKALIGGLFIGISISAMHYTGMAAMRMPALIHYNLGLVILSVLIAISFSAAALWLGMRFQSFSRYRFWFQWLSALVMGLAIVGMHYTGMASASFELDPTLPIDSANALDNQILAVSIFIITFFILWFAVAAAITSQRFNLIRTLNKDLERRVEKRTKQLQEKNRELDVALKQATEYASLVQKGFLPEKPPQHSNYLFAAKTFPAKLVGGDFYDFIPLTKNKLGLLLGDVSGKGVPAALYMAQLVSDFRFHSQKVPSSETILAQINDTLCERSQNGMFATAIYLVLNLEDKTLSVANAGHHALLIRDKNYQVSKRAKAGGIPLGILPGAKYPQEEIQLESGNLVFIYTDGAVDSVNEEKKPFGIAKLIDIVSRENGTPQELITKLQHTIKRYNPNETPFDDLTFLIFQVL